MLDTLGLIARHGVQCNGVDAAEDAVFDVGVVALEACENLQHDQFVEELGEYDHDRAKILTRQDVDDEIAAVRDILKELAAYTGQSEPQPITVA